VKSRSEGPESGTAEPTEQRSLGQLAVRGGGYLVGREAIGMVIRLAGVVLVVREIGPGPYGIYSAAAAFGVFVATLAQLGLEVYLIRMQGEVGPREYNRAFTLLLASSVLATVVAEGLTFLLGGLIRPVGVLLPLRVLLLAIPVNVLWAPAQAAIERDFRYRLMGMLELGGDVVLYATAVPLAFMGAKAWALVAGYFAWQTWLFFGSLATSGLRLRLDWSISAMKDMTRHGVSYSTAQWISRLGDLVNPLVVGSFFGATGVGYVAFGARLVDTIGFAKRGAYRLGMVAMSRVAEGDEHRKRYAIEEGSLLQLLSLAVPFACFGVVARWLVPVVFGHEWVRALPVYSLLALATVLGASGFIQTTFLYSRGRNLTVTGVTAIQSAALAVSAVFLVKHFGIDGYGEAWLIALVALVYADQVVRRMFHFSYSKILPWAVVLCPAVLFPLVRLPWAFLLLSPLLLVSLGSMRAEMGRILTLIRSSMARWSPGSNVSGEPDPHPGPPTTAIDQPVATTQSRPAVWPTPEPPPLPAREQIDALLCLDELTGLPTLPAFVARLSEGLARIRTQVGTVGVILVEVCFGSQPNDVRTAGLLTAARRLSQFLRDRDFVARIGPSLFAVLIDLSYEVDLGPVWERTVEVLSAPVALPLSALESRSSLVSAATGSVVPAEELLRRAAAQLSAGGRADGPPRLRLLDQSIGQGGR